MRTVTSVALLAMTLAASGCGGPGHAVGSASGKHEALEEASDGRLCLRRNAPLKASSDPATARELVPAQPVGALICRYWGSNDSGHSQLSLAKAMSVASTTALDHMVALLDALPSYVRNPPFGTCPVLGGRSDLIIFRYRDGRRDPVRILKECRVPVSNGRVVKEGLGIGPAEGHWPDEGLL
jgi:hypothetical protein